MADRHPEMSFRSYTHCLLWRLSAGLVLLRTGTVDDVGVMHGIPGPCIAIHANWEDLQIHWVTDPRIPIRNNPYRLQGNFTRFTVISPRFLFSIEFRGVEMTSVTQTETTN